MALKKSNDLEIRNYTTGLASAANLESETKSDRRRGPKLFSLAFGLVVFVAVGAGYYFYQADQGFDLNPWRSTDHTDQEIQGLLAQLEGIMLLPSDEVPTVATVADKTKVADQPFFKYAENGDALVAYTKSMQAILYRPSAHKIISVAPIVINPTQ